MAVSGLRQVLCPMARSTRLKALTRVWVTTARLPSRSSAMAWLAKGSEMIFWKASVRALSTTSAPGVTPRVEAPPKAAYSVLPCVCIW